MIYTSLPMSRKLMTSSIHIISLVSWARLSYPSARKIVLQLYCWNVYCLAMMGRKSGRRVWHMRIIISQPIFELYESGYMYLMKCWVKILIDGVIVCDFVRGRVLWGWEHLGCLGTGATQFFNLSLSSQNPVVDTCKLVTTICHPVSIQHQQGIIEEKQTQWWRSLCMSAQCNLQTINVLEIA